MGFLYMIIFLIVISIVTYIFMQKLDVLNSKQTQSFIVWTFRVKGTARGANGRFESSRMLETRRRKVNAARSKF